MLFILQIILLKEPSNFKFNVNGFWYCNFRIFLFLFLDLWYWCNSALQLPIKTIETSTQPNINNNQFHFIDAKLMNSFFTVTCKFYNIILFGYKCDCKITNNKNKILWCVSLFMFYCFVKKRKLYCLVIGWIVERLNFLDVIPWIFILFE